MKSFIILSVALIFFALGAIVGVYVYIQLVLGQPANQPRDVNKSGITSATDQSTAELKASTSTDVVVPIEETTRSAILLSSLPLTDTQKELARTFGIDVETFVITPEMIVCAQNDLGKERYDEIVAGSAPSAGEGLSLLRCL